MGSIVKLFRNAHIIWPNFSGEIGPYNKQVGVDSHGKPIGERFFNIVLTPEWAEDLRNVELVHKDGTVIRGCNVRTHLPKSGEGDPLYTLKVKFGKIAPKEVSRVIPRGRMNLNIDNVGVLDHEIIDHADIKVVLSTYVNGANKGISAYLEKLRAYIQEDEFDNDEAFNNLPIIGDDGFTSGDGEEDLPF